MFEQGSHLSFIKLSFEHKPRVEYGLRIHPSLEYQVWVKDTQLSVTDLREKSFSVSNGKFSFHDNKDFM